MKKIRVIGLAVICLLVAVGMILPVSAATTYIRGDANGDGKVNIADVTTIQKVIAGLETDRDGWIKRRGNVTGGRFDINDATAVQRYLAKLNDRTKLIKPSIMTRMNYRLFRTTDLRR